MDSRLLLFIAVCAVSRIEGQSVTSLTSNITRTGCGSTKLCLTSCDPSANASTCYFGSSQLQSNTTLYFELSGPTSGYVALGLTTNLSLGLTTVYVCGNNVTNNSSNFIFLVTANTSTGLTATNTSSVFSVQGAVSPNQSLIQCTFNTSTNLTATTTRASTSYYVFILNGTLSGGVLGSPNSVYASGTPLDLTNPKSNLNTTNTNTTATTTASSGSGFLGSPVAHALAILLSSWSLLVFY